MRKRIFYYIDIILAVFVYVPLCIGFFINSFLEKYFLFIIFALMILHFFIEYFFNLYILHKKRSK